MKLYYANGTISIAVAIALLEADLPHERVGVDFATAEQTRQPYLDLNPKGRVPALVLDDGTFLTETGAILDYVAAIAPGAGLVPETPVEAAHMRAVMYYLASTMHVAHAHKMRGARWADRAESHADMTAKVPQTMATCAAYIETQAFRGDFVCGDTLTVADAYLFVVCNWLGGDGVDVSQFPRIAAFMDRMAARPSVASLKADGLI
ncbi:glutathione S-transferase family protein [Sulfitobacter sp. HNIBRBA3233]|uniref:glutathione S-transferase family protein n=1 Tax=Sulfitobacter marinivivus TaxID=3158558 RepID=UPI0032DF2DD7